MSANFYVHIVESPSPAELHYGITEGRALCSILDIAGIQRSYNLVVNLDQFHIAMTHQVNKAINEFDKDPILHLSTHGNEKGIQLTSQHETEDLIFWSELTEYIRPIHDILKDGLGVCMSCCGGAHGTQMAKVMKKKDTPYRWIAGSFAQIKYPDAALAYSTFYRRLHCDADNIGCLLEAIRVTSGIADFDIWGGDLIQEKYFQERIEKIRQKIRQKRMEKIRQKIRQRIHENYR